MNEAFDPIRLNAYVDGELSPEEAATIDAMIAAAERSDHSDPGTMLAAEVAALRRHKQALHARYDPLLSESHLLGVGEPPSLRARWRQGGRLALAASLIVAVGLGAAAGWLVRGQIVPDPSTPDITLAAFVREAALSHAVFVPEVRHPVEVAAADEAHLVQWLSKRLDAPLMIPQLGDAGWSLLGGRLLPAEGGPLAQFMYQDGQHRRLTLAVSHARGIGAGAAHPVGPAFGIAEEGGNTVFYWVDADYAYALTGHLPRPEMTALAGQVYRQLDR